MNNNTTTEKKVAIVTGASSGWVSPKRCCSTVIVWLPTRAKSANRKISSDLILVDGDIGKMDSAIKVADAAIEHFDRIDLLVNAAGIYIPKRGEW